MFMTPGSMKFLALAALLVLGSALSATATRSTPEWSWIDFATEVQELSGQGDAEKWKRPDFCGNSECPRYHRDEKGDNFEVRTYEGGKWVTTNTTGNKYELAYTRAATRLIKYFKGGNDKSTSMDLTTPTSAQLAWTEDGQGTDQNYTFGLWIPKEYQEDPPVPTDADLRIEEYPKWTVYVRTFGGFATEGTIIKEAKGFQDMLKDDDRDFNEKLVWVAVYDPPQKLINRHNELHIMAADKKAEAPKLGGANIITVS